ncbi:N-acetylneuraminate synthase [Anaerovorax odorimutans]|uniref:N-acetylneuraminate synthase n=1 Tax=Anaerovorax odorimutans TaxID=109327 RepID=UPI00040E91B8|nr:N-acetylneuraminate synthase [Anaerovorax odorimutans]
MNYITNSKTFIIAEAGVNHNGKLETAKLLAEVAKNAGADVVKFQTFIAEDCISNFASKAEYQKKNTQAEESQLDMVKKIQISFDEFIELKSHCDKIGIQFISTPFDFKSIEFLNHLNIPFWKIPSGEITNVPYLNRIANTGKPVIMSTGMCTLEEVEFAVKLLKENGSGEISLLHCNTEYPTPFKDVNLAAMNTLKRTFNCRTGYSDHTLGIEAPIAAVAMGAEVIEKHFTLDKNMIGPDHKSSLEPDELKKMISAIRNIEMAIGNGKKKPSESEIKNIQVARKSIVAKKAISKGEYFTEENITVKRPGSGISPTRWFDVLGLISTKDYQKDELIEL